MILSALFLSALLSADDYPAGAQKTDPGEAMNWSQTNINGWQTTCDLQTYAEEMPTKCRAYYAFKDGGVSLEYGSKTLTVSVIGTCSNDTGRSQIYRLGVRKVDKLIAEIALRKVANCPAPMLLPQMYRGLPGLNALLTYTVGARL